MLPDALVNINLVGSQLEMKNEEEDGTKIRIAYVSSYPPRECGVATFTEDLIKAVDEYKTLAPGVVFAVNDTRVKYDYDKRVVFQIEKNSVESYLDAALWINDSDIDVVSLQHEFGLFGGNKGENIITFLENLRKPILTTLHTIPSHGSYKKREVLKKILNLSDMIVVVGFKAAEILKQEYRISGEPQIIPHGCPDIPLIDQEEVKTYLGLKDRIVISTLGLISDNKGIEYVIDALPAIIKRNPNIIYAVIGKTHPVIRKRYGERYRDMLARLVDRNGLTGYVIFDNRFLTKKELIAYLQATDIYIVPHTTEDQVSSGTLTYAIVAGKAIVSTPFPHAQELIFDGCGLLCKFRDSDSIAECVINILKDNKLRKEIETNSYTRGRQFLWSRVARGYIRLFERVAKRQVWPNVLAATNILSAQQSEKIAQLHMGNDEG